MWRGLIAAVLLCAACKKHESGFEIRERVASSGEAFSAALQQTVGSPMRPGHTLEVLENGRVFDALIELPLGADRLRPAAENGRAGVGVPSVNELEEGALVAEDAAAAERLAKDFEDDCTRSKEQR